MKIKTVINGKELKNAYKSDKKNPVSGQFL